MKKIKVTSKNLEKAIKKNSKISKKKKATQRQKEKYAINKAMKSQGIKPKKDTDKIILTIFVIIVVIVTIIFYLTQSQLLFLTIDFSDTTINHIFEAVGIVQC